MAEKVKLNLEKKEKYQSLIIRYNGNPQEYYKILSETTFKAPVIAQGWDNLKSYLQSRDFTISNLKIKAELKDISQQRIEELEKIVAGHNKIIEKNPPKEDNLPVYVY